MERDRIERDRIRKGLTDRGLTERKHTLKGGVKMTHFGLSIERRRQRRRYNRSVPTSSLFLKTLSWNTPTCMFNTQVLPVCSTCYLLLLVCSATRLIQISSNYFKLSLSLAVLKQKNQFLAVFVVELVLGPVVEFLLDLFVDLVISEKLNDLNGLNSVYVPTKKLFG